MKKLNVLLITGLVLLLTCVTALAEDIPFGTATGDSVTPIGNEAPVAPVPEPATMLLLGSGLAVLAIGARKKKK